MTMTRAGFIATVVGMAATPPIVAKAKALAPTCTRPTNPVDSPITHKELQDLNRYLEANPLPAIDSLEKVLDRTFPEPLWMVPCPAGQELEYCLSTHARRVAPLGCDTKFIGFGSTRLDKVVLFHKHYEPKANWPRGYRVEIVAEVDTMIGLPMWNPPGNTVKVNLDGVTW